MPPNRQSGRGPLAPNPGGTGTENSSLSPLRLPHNWGPGGDPASFYPHSKQRKLGAGWLWAVALVVGLAGAAGAGPPYLTDDPDPVPYHHWEVYTFYTRDQTRGTDTVNGPALEVNNGVAPNTQLHLVIPQTYFSQGGMSATGLGDVEAGVKYRLLTETPSRPEVGMFPLLELPSGDSSKGLGNGRAWVKVPVWLQKSWGAWTTYGGVGYAYNPAPGQRNAFYGGDLIQYTFNPRLTLGGEIFLQGASANVPAAGTPPVAGARSSALWNLGGQYNFTPDFSLLFSTGHSFAGDGNADVYLALYRTWGPGAP